MPFTLPASLAEQLSVLAQRRKQSVEQLLSDLLAQAERAEADVDFFDVSLELLCVTDRDGHLLRLNPAFCAGLGYRAADLLATPLLALVHPDDLPSALAALEGLRQGQPAAHLVSRCRCADGAYKWLSWIFASLPGGRIYAAAHDITRHKLREAELRAQANALTPLARSSKASPTPSSPSTRIGALRMSTLRPPDGCAPPLTRCWAV